MKRHECHTKHHKFHSLKLVMPLGNFKEYRKTLHFPNVDDKNMQGELERGDKGLGVNSENLI